MSTLREQLLQQGLVSAEQAERADEKNAKNKSRRSKRGGRGRGKPGDDPKRQAMMQALDEHRLAESDYAGDIAFKFTSRGDSKIRKLLVNPKTAVRLGSGELAIVESGLEPIDHIIVVRDAVGAVRAVDPEAIRFLSQS